MTPCVNVNLIQSEAVYFFLNKTLLVFLDAEKLHVALSELSLFYPLIAVIARV